MAWEGCTGSLGSAPTREDLSVFCVSTCITHMPGAGGGQKGVPGSLELEL